MKYRWSAVGFIVIGFMAGLLMATLLDPKGAQLPEWLHLLIVFWIVPALLMIHVLNKIGITHLFLKK